MRPWLLLLISSLLGCATVSPAVPSPRAIAAVRALEPGQAATVEGVVTVVPGTFSSVSGDRGFALQDESGGLFVAFGGAEVLELGERVRLAGTLGRAAQQVVLTATSAPLRLGRGGSPAPLPLATGDLGASVEGRLVKVRGRVTRPVEVDGAYGVKVFLDDGTGEAQVFVHLAGGKPVIDTASLGMGQPIAVIGLASRYEATFEVNPRQPSDLLRPP